MSEIKISDEARECAELFNSEVLRGQLRPGGTTVAALAQRIQLLLNQRDAELRKDKERLDWLEKNYDKPFCQFGEQPIRQAIDAASQTGVKGGEK